MFALLTQTPVVLILFVNGKFKIIGGTPTGASHDTEIVVLSLSNDGSGACVGTSSAFGFLSTSEN